MALRDADGVVAGGALAGAVAGTGAVAEGGFVELEGFVAQATPSSETKSRECE